jgi:hypothetical protein
MVPRRSWVCLVALGVLLAACTAGPSPTPSPVPPSPALDTLAGGIEGTVTDTDGAPIEGAVVQLEQGSFYGTATTSAEGAFRTLGVHGTFVITVRHVGYEFAIRRVEVAPGQLVQVDFTLEPSAAP